MRRSSLLVLLSCVAGASALQIGCASPQLNGATSATRVHVRMGPAPAIAKPKTVTRQKTSGPGGGGGGAGAPTVSVVKPMRKSETEDVPMFKVILLGDEDYEEDAVCNVLMTVIPDITDKRQAKDRYAEADASGKALLCVQPKEHAEMYVEQLVRADPMVFATIEEE